MPPPTPCLYSYSLDVIKIPVDRVFSNRFGWSLVKLADIFNQCRKITEATRKEKDFDCLGYV